MQDRICAVARLIPPGYLPQSGADASRTSGLLSGGSQGQPELAFMIERCWQDRSLDWCLAKACVPSSTDGRSEEFHQEVFR